MLLTFIVYILFQVNNVKSMKTEICKEVPSKPDILAHFDKEPCQNDCDSQGTSQLESHNDEQTSENKQDTNNECREVKITNNILVEKHDDLIDGKGVLTTGNKMATIESHKDKTESDSVKTVVENEVDTSKLEQTKTGTSSLEEEHTCIDNHGGSAEIEKIPYNDHSDKLVNHSDTEKDDQAEPMHEAKAINNTNAEGARVSNTDMLNLKSDTKNKDSDLEENAEKSADRSSESVTLYHNSVTVNDNDTSEDSKLQIDAQRNLFESIASKVSNDKAVSVEHAHSEMKKQNEVSVSSCKSTFLENKVNSNGTKLKQVTGKANKTKRNKTNRKPIFKSSKASKTCPTDDINEMNDNASSTEITILEKAKLRYPGLKELRIALNPEDMKTPVQLSTENASQISSRKTRVKPAESTVRTAVKALRTNGPVETPDKQIPAKELSSIKESVKKNVNSVVENESNKPLKKRTRHMDNGNCQKIEIVTLKEKTAQCKSDVSKSKSGLNEKEPESGKNIKRGSDRIKAVKETRSVTDKKHSKLENRSVAVKKAKDLIRKNEDKAASQKTGNESVVPDPHLTGTEQGGKQSIVKKYPERSCKLRQQNTAQKTSTPARKPNHSVDASVKPKIVNTEKLSGKTSTEQKNSSGLPKKKRKRKVKPWSWGNEKKRSKPKPKTQVIATVENTNWPERVSDNNTDMILTNLDLDADKNSENMVVLEVVNKVVQDVASKVCTSNTDMCHNVEVVTRASETTNIVSDLDSLCSKPSKPKTGKKSKKAKGSRNFKTAPAETNSICKKVLVDSAETAGRILNDEENPPNFVEHPDIHDENFQNVSPDSGIQSLAGSPAGNESPNSVILSVESSTSINTNCVSSSTSASSNQTVHCVSSSVKSISEAASVLANGIVSSVLCVTASSSIASFSVTTSLTSSSETTTVFSNSVPVSSVTLSSSKTHKNTQKSCTSDTINLTYTSSSSANLNSAISCADTSVTSSAKDLSVTNCSNSSISPSKKKKRAKFLQLCKASTLLQKGRLPTEEEKEQRLEDKFDYLSKTGAKSGVLVNVNVESEKLENVDLKNGADNEIDKILLPENTKRDSCDVVKDWLEETERFENNSGVPKLGISNANDDIGEKSEDKLYSNQLDISLSDESKTGEEQLEEKINSCIKTAVACELLTNERSNNEVSGLMCSVTEMCVTESEPAVQKVLSDKPKKRKGKRKRSHSRNQDKAKKKVAIPENIDASDEVCPEEERKLDHPEAEINSSKVIVFKESNEQKSKSDVDFGKNNETASQEKLDTAVEDSKSQVNQESESISESKQCAVQTENLEEKTFNENDKQEGQSEEDVEESAELVEHAVSKHNNESQNISEKVLEPTASVPRLDTDRDQLIKNVPNNDQAILTNVVPVKRKRGRPPLLGKKKTIKVIPLKQKYHQRIIKIKKMNARKPGRPPLKVKPEVVIKRGPGRPKGSKNKVKTNLVKIKRSPGRPKGALNKVKRKPEQGFVQKHESGVKSPLNTVAHFTPTMMQWRESRVITGVEGEDGKKKSKSGRGPGRPRKHPLPTQADTSQKKENNLIPNHSKYDKTSLLGASVEGGANEIERRVREAHASHGFNVSSSKSSQDSEKVKSKFKKKRKKMNKMYSQSETIGSEGLIFPSRLDGHELDSFNDVGSREPAQSVSSFDSDNSGYGSNIPKTFMMQQWIGMNRHHRKKNKKRKYFKSKHKNIIDPVFNAEVEMLTDMLPRLSIRGETYIKVRPGEVPRPSIFKMVRIDVKKKKKDKLFVFEKAKPLKSKIDELSTKDKFKLGRRISTLGESFLDRDSSGTSQTCALPPKKRHKLFSPQGAEVGHDGTAKPEKRKVGRPRKQPLAATVPKELPFGMYIFCCQKYSTFAVNFG